MKTYFKLVATNTVKTSITATCMIYIEYKNTLCPAASVDYSPTPNYGNWIYYNKLYAFPYPNISKAWNAMFTVTSNDPLCTKMYFETY